MKFTFRGALLIFILTSPSIFFAGCLDQGESEEDGPYTEFYILGSEGGPSGYPSDIGVNTVHKIFLGITNQEGSSVTYTLEININDNTLYCTVWDEDILEMKWDKSYEHHELIKDEENIEMPCSFYFTETGEYRMHFKLNMNSIVIRELYLNVNVHELEHEVLVPTTGYHRSPEYIMNGSNIQLFQEIDNRSYEFRGDCMRRTCSIGLGGFMDGSPGQDDRSVSSMVLKMVYSTRSIRETEANSIIQNFTWSLNNETYSDEFIPIISDSMIYHNITLEPMGSLLLEDLTTFSLFIKIGGGGIAPSTIFFDLIALEISYLELE